MRCSGSESSTQSARGYEVLAAQRTTEIAGELGDTAQAAVNAATRLQEAKEVSEVDVLRARVEANSAQLQLAAARKAHDAAWRQLAMVVGMPSMQPKSLANKLDDALPILSWDEIAAEPLSLSPQVAHARSGVDRARGVLSRACAGRTPNIETGASVRYNDDSNDTTLSLQVGMPLAIYDRNQGSIMKAQAELVAAQRNVERVQLLLQDQLSDEIKLIHSPMMPSSACASL